MEHLEKVLAMLFKVGQYPTSQLKMPYAVKQPCLAQEQ